MLTEAELIEPLLLRRAGKDERQVAMVCQPFLTTSLCFDLFVNKEEILIHPIERY